MPDRFERRRVTVLLACMLGAIVTCSADTIYVDGSDANLYTIDPLTGATTLVGSMGTVMTDIAEYKGSMFGVSFPSSGPVSLYSVNPETGASTLIGSTGVYINALEFGTDGTLFGAGGAPGCGPSSTNPTPCDSLYELNVSTGAATLVGSGVYNSSGDLAFDGASLYLTSSLNSSTDQLFSVDATNGSGSLVGNIGFAEVFGLAFDASTSTLYGFNDVGNNVIGINPTTGLGTSVATYSSNFEIYGATTDTVPEPRGVELFLGGLLAALTLLKRLRIVTLDRAQPPSDNIS